MAVLDTTALLYLLEPKAKPPIDPATGQPVANTTARIKLLVATLEKRREAIVIPTPVLSEVLVHANEASPQYLEIINKASCFRIASFDERAAVELAEMTGSALSAGNLRAGTNTTRAKLKFDRQILAIARIEGEDTIYSDDKELAKLGKPIGFTIIPIHKLPSPTGQEGFDWHSESPE